MTNKQKKMLSLLQDTVDEFTVRRKDRCVGSNGYCLYSAENAGEGVNTNGCAIGKHMTPDNARSADATRGIKNTGVASIPSALLPKFMRNLPIRFLVDLQTLHDTEYNWDNYELTKVGQEFVEYISESITGGGYEEQG